MKKFNRTSGGRAITKAEFFPVFNLAWNRSMTADNIKAALSELGFGHQTVKHFLTICLLLTMRVSPVV